MLVLASEVGLFLCENRPTSAISDKKSIKLDNMEQQVFISYLQIFWSADVPPHVLQLSQ